MLRKKYTFIIQLYKTQQALDDRIMNDILGIDRLKENIFILENKVKEKEIKLKNMKEEMDRFFNFPDKECKVIFVSEPYAVNTELYNELTITKEIYDKLNKLYYDEKEKNKKLENRLMV